MELRGRLIVVTGASSGLGRAIAKRLACGEGADVVLAARRADRLRTLQQEIAGEGAGRAFVCEVDLSHPGGPKKLLDAALEIAADRSGAPSGAALFGLANVAGSTWYGSVAEMPAEDARRIVDLNCSGTIELTRLFVRTVLGEASRAGTERSRGPHAAILTVTSLGALVPAPYQAVYTATKHALHGFHEALTAELRALRRTSGVRIVTTEVAPGGIATEMVERSGLKDHFASGSRAEPSSILLAPPDRIAASAVVAWRRERSLSVPGLTNKVAALASRLLPRPLIRRIGERLYRP
ncbi:MAG: SDR family NAD(P)-dependent oxidoreductase [Spirochaetota bacterium]